MRTEHKIITASVVIGLLIWLLDAALDHFLFYHGTFMELFITNVPKHELYIRTVILASFVCFGIVAARLISKQKQIEQNLSKALRFEQQLLNAIPAPVFYKDKALIYTGCNKSFEAFLNKDRKEIIGKSAHELSPGNLADVYLAKDRELIDHPGIQVYEFEAAQKNGETRKVVFNKATFEDPDGEVAGLIGVILDITERKKAEEEKEELIAELEATLEKVKTLSGLLPICSSCKNIRDDRGYWTRIETYLHEHSEAEFSHSLCPDCAQKLYPRYFKSASAR